MPLIALVLTLIVGAGIPQAPTSADEAFKAGVRAYKAGQMDIARVHCIDALKHDPALTDASLLLGDILYRADDLSGAINVYAQALVHAPSHARIAERLDAWRKEAALHERFGQKLGDHFTVLFEGPAEAQLAQKAVEILEAAYWRIGGALYTYPYGVLTVVLYTREQFRDVTQSPEWAGGVYDGRIRMPVRGALENMREFERVLAHELTHAIVHGLAPRGVPVWLNEGLAMNFEGTDPRAKEAELASAETRPSLRDLERSFAKLGTPAAKLAYAQSAVAVHRLLQDAGAPAVVGILTDLGRGIAFADAFERHANISYGNFQRTIDQSANR
ncbi:MAG TPA: hypothetical protein VNJ04_09905 [Gemmatimonadaceae bacterium]|nr:hypothetical protein [Gemmatimonadaceae bacterium]